MMRAALRAGALAGLTGLVLVVGCAGARGAEAPPATQAAVATTRPATSRPARNEPRSPEFNPDGSVTFRLRAPQAQAVSISGEWGMSYKQAPLTKDEQGVWSITYPPAAPNVYSYTFTVDGQRVMDPGNHFDPKPGAPPVNLVEVGAGGDPLASPYALRDVPHGTIHVHRYQSQSLNLARRLHVYTPPGYEGRPEQRYPVLLLLHGSGDEDSTWTTCGKANLLLDNLIAAGKAVPMVVVMPDGQPKVAGRGFRGPQPEGAVGPLERDVFGDILPLLERTYRVRTDAAGRAIAGLSLGGTQTMQIGLNHADTFAWIGSFSGWFREFNRQEGFFIGVPADAAATSAKRRLLWLACGSADGLFGQNRDFDQELTRRGLKHTWRPIEGAAHCWPLWRENLREFLPLLFRE